MDSPPGQSLGALDFISATACSPTVPEGLKISLLAVEYPQLTHELEMEPWKTTVHNLFARLPVGSSSFNLNLNAEAVIETIAKHINEQEMPPSGNTIFRAFKDDTKPIKFDGNVHCEAILASLVKYVDTEKDPQIESVSLKVLIQVNMFTLHDHDVHQSDTFCIEFEPEHHRDVTSMLSGLLGALRHLEGRGHEFQCPRPPCHSIPS
jgi:hypothetical protein